MRRRVSVTVLDRFDRCENKHTSGQKRHELGWRVDMCGKYDPSIQMQIICYCRLRHFSSKISQMFTHSVSLLKFWWKCRGVSTKVKAVWCGNE